MDKTLEAPLRQFVEGYATQNTENTDALIHEYLCKKTQKILFGEAACEDAEEADDVDCDEDEDCDDKDDKKDEKKDDKSDDDKKDDKKDEDDKK
jgi:hypothetical protein